ncbi:hypothetical protein Efla_001363 [Eimeria flavescens]
MKPPGGLSRGRYRMRSLWGHLLLSVAVCVASAEAFRLGLPGGASRILGSSSSSSSSSRTGSSFTACNLAAAALAAAAAAGAAAAPAAAAGAAATEGQLDVDLVKKLRQLTSAGYGSCVRALQQSGGDLAKAVSWLRQRGAADAAAAAAAAAAAGGAGTAPEAAQQQQGLIALHRLDTAAAAAEAAAETEAAAGGVERVVAVHLACCTDFVSRSSVFTAAARRAAAAACHCEALAAEARAAAAQAAAAATQPDQQQQLLQHVLSLPSPAAAETALAAAADTAAAAAELAAATTKTTVADDLGYLSRLVGERTTLRRVAVREARKGKGIVSSYCHQPLAADVAPLAVLLQLSYTRQQQQHQQQGEEEGSFESQLRQFGKQLCMHIAAAKPLAIRLEDLPPSLVAQERQFALESLSRSSSSSSKKSNSSSSTKAMPEALKQKIVEGKLSKWHREVVLLSQPWALDDSGRSVADVVRDWGRALSAKLQVEAFDLLEATNRGA